tara:strand:- start:799 stop:1368 length:570 start_codon:yes stop_codon:yes gene_type:complete
MKKSILTSVLIDENGIKWEVDVDTGELTRETKEKKMPAYSKKYYGIDTRCIRDCKTKDQLLETLHLIDGYMYSKTRVSDTFLAENITEGCITPQQLTFLRALSKKITAWNIYIGTKQELLSMGTNPKSFSRMIKDLHHFIRVVESDTPDKGCIKILVNPLLVWKGDLEWREHMKREWYKAKRMQIPEYT